MNLSLFTVKSHLKRLIAKPGVSDRTQEAVKDVEMGLVEPEHQGVKPPRGNTAVKRFGVR